MTSENIARKAAEYGLKYLQEVGSPLIPFSLYFVPNEDPRNSQLHYTRHNADTLALGLEAAYANVKATSGIPLYAIAWDGYVTIDSKKSDAILIEVGQSDKEEGVIYAQRYEERRKALIRKTLTQVPVGEIVHAGVVKSRIFR